MSYLSANLNILITAVKKATSSLSRDFSEIERLQSSIRGYKDFVATAIKKVENNLRTELSKARPNYAFAENNKPQPQGPHYIVSALDGVENFSHGIPHFAVSVAICENDMITAAVIYNPATDECYFAEKGSGAYKEGYRNHERLRVSARKELQECVISLPNKSKQEIEHETEICRRISSKVLPEISSVRSFGCSSLDFAYVASGKLDALIGVGKSINEMAAGILLVKEAGGAIYEIAQKDIRSENIAAVLHSGDVVACNANMGKTLTELLN